MLNKVTKAIDQLIHTFPTRSSAYPLESKSTLKVQAKLDHFVKLFVQHGRGTVLFDEEASLLETVIAWLTSMSTSVVRALRHTGAYIGVSIEPVSVPRRREELLS